MKIKNLSLKKSYFMFLVGIFFIQIPLFVLICLKVSTVLLLSISVVTILVSIFWSLLLMKNLKTINTNFVDQICETIDEMAKDKTNLKFNSDEETLFSKVEYKLCRLYEMLQVRKNSINEEKLNLESLISDISHQLKTPATNLKMALSFLKEEDFDEKQKLEYLNTIESQVDKIEFLIHALIKTSRLETGIIKLEKSKDSIYETIALAVGNIYLEAKKKSLDITVKCSEDLLIPHDVKWTAEAIFNILDNAVKYTPKNGRISICVEDWEQYTKIDIEDSGIGIVESSQGKIFQRFYRENSVHNIEGIGIGLYLSRNIISKEGGYIKVFSKIGEGSTFSIFLPHESFKDF